jgi:hypothetical protein
MHRARLFGRLIGQIHFVAIEDAARLPREVDVDRVVGDLDDLSEDDIADAERRAFTRETIVLRPLFAIMLLRLGLTRTRALGPVTRRGFAAFDRAGHGLAPGGRRRPLGDDQFAVRAERARRSRRGAALLATTTAPLARSACDASRVGSAFTGSVGLVVSVVGPFVPLTTGATGVGVTFTACRVGGRRSDGVRVGDVGRRRGGLTGAMSARGRTGRLRVALGRRALRGRAVLGARHLRSRGARRGMPRGGRAP